MPTTAIIPNRNHADELRISLEAVATQTRPFEEIIIVDDASTDHSLEVIGEFCRRFPRIRLLRNERLMGVALTVSRALAEVRTPYVIMASADERLSVDMHETLRGAIDRHPDAKVAVGRYAQWFPHLDNKVIEHGPDSDLGMWFLSRQEARFITPLAFRTLLKERFVWLPTTAALFRREVLIEVGGYDPSLRWHSDWFAIYAIALRHGFCAIDRTVGLFRVSEHSYSQVGMQNRKMQREVVLAIQKKLHSPGFEYFNDALRAVPSAMSPFIRETVLALLPRPRYYPMLAAIAAWWLGEFLTGRRPGFVKRWIGRHRPKPPGRSRDELGLARRNGDDV